MRWIQRLLAGSFISCFALGCGEGDGMVRVTAYGEPFIEDGIPSEEMADAWMVSFDRFSVALSDVRVAGAELALPTAVDLAQSSAGEGHELGVARVSEGRYADASFVIGRVEVDGLATLGPEEKRFSWTFDAPTAYSACEARTRVPDGGTGTLQITVHADHLFYDSLVAEQPRVSFQALADADADADGQITETELAATGIGGFDPGSAGGVENLWQWLEAATRTLGHVDGEGHCEATALDPS